MVYEAVISSGTSVYKEYAEPHLVTVTVQDNDLPVVRVKAGSRSYREGEFALFRIIREGQTSGRLPVNVEVTQKGGQRIVSRIVPDLIGTAPVPIQAGHADEKLYILLAANDGDEENDVITIKILEGDGYNIDPAGATASFTIVDTDPPPALRVESTDRSVGEGDGKIEFTVSYTGPGSHRGVSVDYTTLAKTAAAGVDYTATTGTLTFKTGDKSAVITVPVAQDTVPEADETFFLRLTNPVNATFGGGRAITTLVTILDDEPRPEHRDRRCGGDGGRAGGVPGHPQSRRHLEGTVHTADVH